MSASCRRARHSEGDGLKLQHIVILVGAGLVALVIAGAGTAFLVTHLVSGEYEQPASSDTVEPAPRDEAEVDIAVAQAAADAQKPLVETPYRQIGGISSRLMVWVPRAVAPAVRGVRARGTDLRPLLLKRSGTRDAATRATTSLAYEFTKLLSVSFSLTATFGAFLTFMLVILYPKFMNYLFERLLADVPAVRAAVLRRGGVPVLLLLRLGQVPPGGPPRPRAWGSTSSARRSCSSPTRGCRS